MKILWHRIVAFGLVVTALVLLVSHRNEIAGFLLEIKELDPSRDPREQYVGFIALGFVAACLLCALKIALQQRDRGE